MALYQTDDLTSLRHRMYDSAQLLLVMAKEVRGPKGSPLPSEEALSEAFRLLGKAEGLNLAVSYLNELIRDHS